MESCSNGNKRSSLINRLFFWKKPAAPQSTRTSIVSTESDKPEAVAVDGDSGCGPRQTVNDGPNSAEYENEGQIVEQGSKMRRPCEAKAELEARIEAQSKKLKEIELELSLRREEAQNNQWKLANYRREKETLAEALALAQQEVSESKEVARSLQTEIESLRSDSDTLKTENGSVKRENDSLKRDKNSLTVALSESETQLRQLLEISGIPETSLRKTGKKVASGAFGDVFIGVWLGVSVAVKSFHEELQGGNNKRMFDQEIAVCCRIHHPNIVCTFGIVRVTDRMPEIVMELLECSLAQLMMAALKSPRYLTIREQLDLCSNALAGIVYLHHMSPQPLLHGDIRATNILITTTMEAKIADFGASHFIRSSLSIGPLSLDYLAPERMPSTEGHALGNTSKADMYSLGVTVVEILTGEPAVRMARQRQLRQVIHDGLRDMCLQMTAEIPTDRLAAKEAFEIIEAAKNCVEYDRCPPRRKVRRTEEEGNQFVCKLSALA